MSSLWINIRVGRYFFKVWPFHFTVTRMTDAWMRTHGQTWVKVWRIPGYRAKEYRRD